MLDARLCRKRQRKLLAVLEESELDGAVLGHRRHVHYFANHRCHWLQESALLLAADGRSWLFLANKTDPDAAVDAQVTYEAQWHATQRSGQPGLIAAVVRQCVIALRARRIGIDASAVTSMLTPGAEQQVTSLESSIAGMRRVKDEDELALMKVAIRCSEAMHARARELIEPGIAEITMFTELHAAAVREAGEPLSAYLGNDYACGAGGGAPRDKRVAAAGEIYILDLGPAYRGYFADNARSLAVDRNPTDAQLAACESVVGVFSIVERMVRPGVRCRDVYEAASAHLAERTGSPLSHHLGHGVGLEPHEAPHLNPRWDDVFQEHEIFTAEPGVYRPDLRGGIRIENQYRITTTGVENLTPFPLELK